MPNSKAALLKKKQVLKSIREMPEEFALDDAIDRLVVLHKIQQAEKQVEQGHHYTTEQARKKLKKWLA